MSQAKNRELTLLVTAGILLAFAVVDFYTPALLRHQTRSEWLMALAFGACIAQVTLIATWAVFAPGNIVVRLPWSLLLGLMMWYILAFGERQAAGRLVQPRNIVILGLVLLLGVTVLQIPMWIAKQAFRYRMPLPDELPTSAEWKPVQFQLSHLILGTFLLSVALSPIRLVLPKENIGNLMPDRELLVLVLAAMAVNLVATVPCLWGGFVSSRRVWALIMGWSSYGFIVTLIEFALLCAVLGDPHDPKAFWVFLVMNFTQGALVFAVMRIYFTLGYRLQRVKQI